MDLQVRGSLAAAGRTGGEAGGPVSGQRRGLLRAGEDLGTGTGHDLSISVSPSPRRAPDPQ